MATPIPFSEIDEAIPPDEPQHIVHIVEIVRQTLQFHLAKTHELHRDVHAKSNGSALADFHVLPDLPAELAQGLFSNPATYPAVVRFSNSAPWYQADVIPDGRGLAIQVDGVPGEKLEPQISSQDFILVNHPAFIAANVRDFLQIQESRLAARDEPLQLAAAVAAKSLNPLHWISRENLSIAQVAAQPPAHPASYDYFSMSAIRYGNYVAKYRVKPAVNLLGSWLHSASRLTKERDAMRHLLAETLQEQELRFEFQVQLRTSATSMPIEDAAVVWPEDESPFRTVAHLVLPRQQIESEQVDPDGERRSFQVWNALAAHRPLGGINRLRKAVYPVSAAFRHATGIRHEDLR